MFGNAYNAFYLTHSTQSPNFRQNWVRTGLMFTVTFVVCLRFLFFLFLIFFQPFGDAVFVLDRIAAGEWRDSDDVYVHVLNLHLR